ncbi:MCE family protein [Nocardioides sp. ChNu-153]|uniref:MCE family protein n=1 Tax=Nocardioides sp. ChNu-153 TaxID=2779364 RepID=UPI0026531151|nr:MlaD family protein [Nocardioides sp. ChNu-153]MDN7121795.1 MCE family protein [Nocardioides sp. ChNu-153]
MSRLLPSKLVLSVIGLVVVFAVTLAYMLTSVLNLPLTGRPASISIDLPRSGGLFEGSAASYRGSRVGTVDTIRINPEGGITATVSLSEGTEIPESTQAQVRSLSPVGEQYLDFRPKDEEGPYLTDGDRISAEAVDIPVSFAEAAESLNGFIRVIDEDQLQLVLAELGAATDGVGDDLETLLDATDNLSATLDAAFPETQRLLTNGQTVGELLEGNIPLLERFSTAAASISAFLRDFDPQFREILGRTGADFANVELLVADLRPVLPPLLTQLNTLGQVVYEREPHLRALPDALFYGMSRFASAFEGGWLNLDLWLQGAQECDYREYRGDPRSTDRLETYVDGRCAIGGPVRRGAQYAPPPLDR